MSWDYNFTDKALKEFRKLDRPAQQRIIKFLDKHCCGEEANPRTSGKALTGNLGEFWRYRVGDYRILCEISDARLLVLIVKTGHRREVYQ
jgi:mRNA interferase RelE/StbE